MLQLKDVQKWDCRNGKAVAVNPSFDNIGKYPPLESDNKNWNEFNQWSSDPANQPTTELTGIYGSEQVEVVEQYRHGHCDWQNGSPEYQIPNVSYIFRYKLIEKPVVFNIETAVPEMISMVNKLSEMFPEPLPPVIGEESQKAKQKDAARITEMFSNGNVPLNLANLKHWFEYAFENGVKWQSTRMYAEQQVIELLEKMKLKLLHEPSNHPEPKEPITHPAAMYFYAIEQKNKVIRDIDPKQFINELKTKIRCKE